MPLNSALFAFWPVFSAALSLELAAAFVLLADGEFFDSPRLIALCIIGGIGGAVTSLTIFPPRPECTVRHYMLKIAASFFSAICLAPMALEYIGRTTSSNFTIGVSFVISLFIVSALHKAIPLIEAWWAKWVKSKLPKVDDPEQPPK